MKHLNYKPYEHIAGRGFQVRTAAGLAALLTIFLSACDFGITGVNFVPYPDVIKHTFSFETDMEGWAAIGADLGEPEASWSIDESDDYATDGLKSLKLSLDNPADSAKIWIERIFMLDRNATYSVKVRYSFASKDGGNVDKWKIIAGVHSEQPRTAEELTYHGDTGNSGLSSYSWQEQTYDFVYEAGTARKAYVAIGVWGTGEDERAYYIDDVRITFTKVQQTE